MSPDNPMVEFFAQMGHKIIKSPSSWWYEVQPGILFALPYYKQITPNKDEIDDLIKTAHLSAIRYPTTLNNLGFLSTVAINCNRDYDFAHLHPKARNQTKRGLENCQIMPIDFNQLQREGLQLNIETSIRQGRDSQNSSKDYWDKFCLTASQTKGIHAWGSFYKNKLASFLVAVETENNWIEWIINHSSTSCRKYYSNNALAFVVGQHYLRERGVNGICYGLGSLEETDSLDHFKIRMGWTNLPIKQRLEYSLKYRIIAEITPIWALRVAKLLYPKNYFVRKASAMILNYRQQTLTHKSETTCKESDTD